MQAIVMIMFKLKYYSLSFVYYIKNTEWLSQIHGGHYLVSSFSTATEAVDTGAL